MKRALLRKGCQEDQVNLDREDFLRVKTRQGEYITLSQAFVNYGNKKGENHMKNGEKITQEKANIQNQEMTVDKETVKGLGSDTGVWISQNKKAQVDKEGKRKQHMENVFWGEARSRNETMLFE